MKLIILQFTILIFIFTSCGTNSDQKSDDANAQIVKTEVEESTKCECSCGGKTTTKTCPDDCWCDCSSGSPKVVCCSGSNCQ